MDDVAEIGTANHIGYEKEQEHDRARRDAVPEVNVSILMRPMREE